MRFPLALWYAMAASGAQLQKSAEIEDQMLRTRHIWGALLILGVTLQACRSHDISTPETGLANPASVHCQEMGGTLEIQAAQGGQEGICLFPDGSECEEWALYRGDCQRGSRTSPTPSTSTKRIQIEEYGFSILPPDFVEIRELDNLLLFEWDGYQLKVGYRRPEELITPLGEPAPEGRYLPDTPLEFFSGTLPKERLVEGDQIKLVQYYPFQISDLQFFIQLRAVTKDYEKVNIPAEVIAQADEMIVTLRLAGHPAPRVEVLRGTQSNPDAEGWASYQNQAYGFGIRYPADWQLDDANLHYLQLQKDGAGLHLGFRRPGETTPLVGTGAPAGELVPREPVMILGEARSSQALVAEGNTIAIFYEPIYTPGLEIGIRGDQIEPHREELSPALIREMNQIATTLEIFGPAGGLAIYLLPDDIRSGELSSLDLAAYRTQNQPLITLEEIESYDPVTHEMVLTFQGFQKIQALYELPVRVDGIPFVVQVGQENIYAGAFWTPLSSLSFDGVVIMQPFDPDKPVIQIGLGYPGESFSTILDPRPDPRILAVFREAGKLK